LVVVVDLDAIKLEPEFLERRIVFVALESIAARKSTSIPSITAPAGTDSPKVIKSIDPLKKPLVKLPSFAKMLVGLFQLVLV
jgi:hypothetical protein